MPQLYFKNKRKLWLAAIIGYLVIAIGAILPILIAISAGAIAESHDCTANEAGSYPCVIGGIDYGGLIYFFIVFGWFFLISFPLAFIGLYLWTSKVSRGFRLLNYDACYALTELEDVSIREFEGRMYLEARIDQQGYKRPIMITFKHKKEEYRFKEGRCASIKGLLKEDNNYGNLILYDSIVDSK